jgi:FkbM family methyltransferase
MFTYSKDLEDPRGNYNFLWEYVAEKKIKTAIDIGAWWGPWTIWWSKYAERVEAFEPNPLMHKRLEHNFSQHSNCFFHKVALGDRKGDVSMSYKDHSGTNYVTKSKGDIPMHTLDDYNFNNVDIIKIDVEGYEIPVLEGAKKTIARDKPLIQIEANKSGHVYGRTKRDILNYLQDIGMKRLAKKWPDQIWSF